MKNHSDVSRDEVPAVDAPFKNGRRRFLQGAASAAGALALGCQLTAHAEEVSATASTPAPEMLVPIPEKVLTKVGGADVVDSPQDKVIIARTAATTVVACSAVCTHKGGIVEYDQASGEFVCPRHGARFGIDGRVKQGPARRNLKSYKARLAVGLSEKTGA